MVDGAEPRRPLGHRGRAERHDAPHPLIKCLVEERLHQGNRIGNSHGSDEVDRRDILQGSLIRVTVLPIELNLPSRLWCPGRESSRRTAFR
jgi:hypothetical protein